MILTQLYGHKCKEFTQFSHFLSIYLNLVFVSESMPSKLNILLIQTEYWILKILLTNKYHLTLTLIFCYFNFTVKSLRKKNRKNSKVNDEYLMRIRVYKSCKFLIFSQKEDYKYNIWFIFVLINIIIDSIS